MVDVPAAPAVSANDEHDFRPRILALLHCISRRLKYCSTGQSCGLEDTMSMRTCLNWFENVRLYMQ